MPISPTRLAIRLEEPLMRDGYAVMDILSETHLTEMRDAYEALAPKVQGFDSTILKRDTHYRVAVDAAIRRILKPELDTVVPGYRISFCTFVVKAPNSPESAVPLHQDWSFVDEREHVSLGLWAPLVDVGTRNGCLQVVPRSHAFPHAPRAACTPFAYPELVPQLLAECLDTVPMKAGQAMLFDSRLFHCSPPNASSDKRAAATALLVPKTCKMRYYHVVDARQPQQVEVFEVEDEFFLSHIPGTRPVNAVSLGLLDLRDWA